MNRSHIHWPCLPLSEAFWFQEGPGVRKWQFTNSGIKLLNVGNIEKEGTLNLAKTDRHLSEEEVANKYSHFLVDAGDLVIASSGISFDDDGFLRTRGAFVEKHQLPLCLNTSTIRFKAIEGVSDLCFLRFWLNGHEFRSQITKLVTGTAQQNFGPSHLKAIKITLPPLEEQRRIAEILDRAQSLISKRREAIGQLDTLTQAIFLEMFGDPVTNPKGWKIKICKSICSRITVGIVVQPASYYQEYGVPALRSQNIKQNSISTDNLVFFSQIDNETKLAKTRVRSGDVVLVRTGQPGTAAIIPEELDGVNAIDLLITTPCKNIVDSVYLCSFFNSAWGKKLVSSSQVGQIQKHLNVGILNNAQIICPPLPLQQEFAHRVEAVEKLKAAHRASLSELNALFASLQHRAFRGEL